MFDIRVLLTVFISVFLAELGDKTQLATFLFASTNKERLSVFVGSSLALILSSALAVLVGGTVGKFFSHSTIKIACGIGFIAIGIWILINKT